VSEGSTPLRVLVVSMWPTAERPEHGIFVQRQVEALRRAGCEVEVAPLTDARTGRLRTPVKYLRLAMEARRTIRRLRPDVVHAHFLVPTGSVTRACARRARVPYVVTAHGTDVANAESSPALRARTEAVVRDAAAVIAVSDALAARLRALFPGLRVETCDMGVDTTRFTPETGSHSSTGSDDGSIRTVTVASLLPNKNHARLIEAVARTSDTYLVCIGDGPERPTLDELARELGLGARVAMRGRASADELVDCYHNADAACLVSLKEGFGIAVLEALACGCPVVVSRTAPVSQLVEPGVTGVVVDPEDVDDIARGLREVAHVGRLSGKQVAAITRGRTVDDRAAQTLDVLRAAATGRSTS
jgi:glycosyltransferase involved in cell wall biosynthesis